MRSDHADVVYAAPCVSLLFVEFERTVGKQVAAARPSYAVVRARPRRTELKTMITGGCLCGAVRYKCSEPPQSMGVCQCERCQRQSGSAFLIATVFAQHAVNISGELKAFVSRAADGSELSRHFCPNCGSAVMITLDRYPLIRSLMGGTLDNKNILKPSFSLWSESGQPWLELPPGIEIHPQYPDGLVG